MERNWQYIIGRSILLSDQSTPPCCPWLLACLLVSCSGTHRASRLSPLSAERLLSKFVIGGTDPILFKKGWVNRFKARSPHMSPLFDSIFMLWNAGSCLIIPSHPLYTPADAPVPSINHRHHPPPATTPHPPPSLDKKVLTHVTFTAHTPFKTPSCSPEIGHLFLIPGVHLEAIAFCQCPSVPEGGMTTLWMS